MGANNINFKVGDIAYVTQDGALHAQVSAGDIVRIQGLSCIDYTVSTVEGRQWSLNDSVLSKTPPVTNDVGQVIASVQPGTVLELNSKLGTNPKDLVGIKKVQLNLVPASSMVYQALAMEDGARKYGPYNWRDNKVIASIYIAAAMRHLQQWFDGEEFTSDSGVPNLGSVLACIGIIVDAKESGNLVDDRPSPGPASRLIDELAAKKSQKIASTTTHDNGTKKE